MDQITHEVRLANWKQIIEDCQARPEGQSAKQWLTERDISTKCYYYWQRKLRLQAYDQMKQSNALPTVQEDETEMKMNVQIGDYTFIATLEQNQAVKELVDLMKEGPVTIEMSDYSGFEKVGPLGKELTADNHQTTTTEGDIVLYNGNQIVIFYGSNSWSYTRIGKIDDLTDWKKALGSGDVTAVFTVAECSEDKQKEA